MNAKELIHKLILREIKVSQGMMLAKALYKDCLTKESYQWICFELDHYVKPESIPEYRVIDCVIKVVIRGYYIGRRVEELDTSYINSILSDTDKPFASPNKMLIRQSIESLEDSLEATCSMCQMELLKDQVELLMQYYKIPDGCRVDKMYQECRIEHIKNIIPCVRNNLIDILQQEVVPVESKDAIHEKSRNRKTVFISYGWDSAEHREWVKKLAERLSLYFDVLIDEEVPLGGDLNVFMEEKIKSADRVLLILTPVYKEKADNRVNGVGYESVLISSDLYCNQGSTKFIPIIRKGTVEECYPRYMGRRKGLYMTDDGLYERCVEKLVNDIIKN